jgi:hypothetical protein
MLKATKVQALALQLTEGGQATVVQDGPEWNNLRKFKCIAPPELDGQTIIATQDHEGSPLRFTFGALLGLEDERWVVVMASHDIGKRLKG